MGEEQSQVPQGSHFQIKNIDSSASALNDGSSPMAMADSFHTPISAESCHQDADAADERLGGATVFQTSLNMGKICMGTGTLALPFAAEKGGLIFNVVGLFLIGLWNYYSARCLLRCLQFLPKGAVGGGGKVGESCSMAELDQQRAYGTMDSVNGETRIDDELIKCSDMIENEQLTGNEYDRIHSMPPPPNGTTAYGAVAWYACGPKGLMALDLLMLSLFFGLLIAYEVAMMSFISDTPLTTGSRRIDLLIPSAIVAILSCAPDISFLSKFSGMGLIAVALSFLIVAIQGFEENGCSGFRRTSELNLWPSSLSAASSWFGVIVFGFGVVPFIFNFRDSMASPQHISLSLQIGLLIVYVGYILISNGVQVLFSPTHTFDGDVLQAMPNDWISSIVRLLMTTMVTVTAPLIAVPCGELIEGKLGIENSMHKRIAVRVLCCIVSTVFSEFVPSGFVNVVSFIGCFCVATVGFVLPPLFCIQLSNQRKSACNGRLWVDSALLCDAGALVLGIFTTAFTSALTFHELVGSTELEKVVFDQN